MCPLSVLAVILAVAALAIVVRIDRRHAREDRRRQELREAIRVSLGRPE